MNELLMNTHVLVESAEGKKEISMLTYQLSNRRIYLTDEITSETATAFVLQMQYLAQEKEPVDIFINSPGGSANAGLVIYDVPFTIFFVYGIHYAIPDS